MPSWDICDHQPQAHRDNVLPPDVKARLASPGVRNSCSGWRTLKPLLPRIARQVCLFSIDLTGCKFCRLF